jgi:hypothetical protein
VRSVSEGGYSSVSEYCGGVPRSELVARAGTSTLGVSSSVEEAQLMSRQHLYWWGPLKST